MTLQALFSILDMGLSSTLNRELARLTALANKNQEMRNLVRTLEVLYWGMALLIGLLVAAVSPFIAQYWIKAGALSTDTIASALLIMGFVIALQMPIGLYSGGLMGLQRQVLLNVITVCMSTFRGFGAVLVLWLISPTIQSFFLWQIITSILNIIILSLLLWNKLPSSENHAVFQLQLLKGIWKFAAGIFGISLLGVTFSHLDKIILSKMLTLENFGYYTLASVVAMSLYRIIEPVYSAIYPRFTQLIAMRNQDELKILYHKCCQFLAVLILPVAIIIVLFSYEILLLWTQNPDTTQKTYQLVSVLTIGTALNGLMYTPYALQLASGWTSLSLGKNIVAVIVFVPLIILMATNFGAIGAAMAWPLLHIALFFIEIPIMHKRLLEREKLKWYMQDVCLPLFVGLSVTAFCRLFFIESMSQSTMVLYLSIVSSLTLIFTAIATPFTRHWLHRQGQAICRL